MKVLAIDTSSRFLSIAILDNENLLADLTLSIRTDHSKSLIPTVDFLVNNLKLSPTDLDRIVVAKGPGSYTGLRVSVATAKTLASTLKIGLVGVSSFLSLVPCHISGITIPIMDARRKNVYAGFYENGQVIDKEGHFPIEEVLKKVSLYNDKISFVGEVGSFRDIILQHFPEAELQETYPSAYTIGKIGLYLPVTNPIDFVPNYLRRVEAEETWLKKHQDSEGDYIKHL